MDKNFFIVWNEALKLEKMVKKNVEKMNSKDKLKFGIKMVDFKSFKSNNVKEN